MNSAAWKDADNACEYTVTRGEMPPITGTCNIATSAGEPTVGSETAGLMFQGGADAAAMPYDRLNLDFSVQDRRWADLQGFHYELGDDVDHVLQISAQYFAGARMYSGASAGQILQDRDAVSATCRVTITPTEGNVVDADELTFDIESADPVCRAARGDAIIYEVHGSLTARCEGTFGPGGVPSELVREDVTIEITF